MPPECSKATFSSLQEASILFGVSLKDLFGVSLKDLCHQDGARSRFPAFRKLLSNFVKFGGALGPLNLKQVDHLLMFHPEQFFITYGRY